MSGYCHSGKKSEILRDGLLLLETLSEDELKHAIGQDENIKTGRLLKPAE
ncbi:hypothetical protein GO003_017995 [Methylicorpusculum oleiharenae]|nr:hypothetical protein [Methylicorpusculum oleiharenae]MCD2452284.1 hypothetical protein [Methylicorpusculum oleiharenae]